MDDLARTILSHADGPDATSDPSAVYSLVVPSVSVPRVSTMYIRANAYQGWDDEDDAPREHAERVRFEQYRVRVSHPVRRFVLERGSTSAPPGGDVPLVTSWTRLTSFSTVEAALACLRTIVDTAIPDSSSLFHERTTVYLFCGTSFAGRYDLAVQPTLLESVLRDMRV